MAHTIYDNPWSTFLFTILFIKLGSNFLRKTVFVIQNSNYYLFSFFIFYQIWFYGLNHFHWRTFSTEYRCLGVVAIKLTIIFFVFLSHINHKLIYSHQMYWYPIKHFRQGKTVELNIQKELKTVDNQTNFAFYYTLKFLVFSHDIYSIDSVYPVYSVYSFDFNLVWVRLFYFFQV